MVLTDWKKEIDGIIRSEGLTWQQIGDRAGTTRQGAFGVIHDTVNIVPKSIVKILEALGYDIEIEFVRKK